MYPANGRISFQAQPKRRLNPPLSQEESLEGAEGLGEPQPQAKDETTFFTSPEPHLGHIISEALSLETTNLSNICPQELQKNS